MDDDEPQEFDDVEADFVDAASERWNAKNVECTPGFVQRKYAFDKKGIPREETNWVEATTDFPGLSWFLLSLLILLANIHFFFFLFSKRES